ncbi:MAG: response regulator [Gemmatimonadetes bacterium]|nr:response regulator [Gemmatimonadota bacterium]
MTPAVDCATPELTGHALIVDDEPAIRSVVRRWFERRGWHVDEASDGAGAKPLIGELAAGRPAYDVIVADLRMPVVNGAELHEWISAHRPDLVDSVVIATGDVYEADAAAFLDRSRCRVLQKPFSLSALADVVAAIKLPSHSA